MIELSYTNGEILVYNVDDWVILRQTHRIVGEIIGNTNHIPSLPVKIIPEEAILLLEKQIIVIKEFGKADIDKDVLKKELESYESELLQAQSIEYKKIRTIQLRSMLDKIVEKRRQQNDNRTAEEILNEEVQKSTVITKSNMLWPIELQKKSVSQTGIVVGLDVVLKFTNKLRSAVYSDLWERGYYITQGVKFGGDFLVYLGDPLCYHAIFIVKCIDNKEPIAPSEIVAFGRLGTAVKKKAVLASFIDDKVTYITINWIDA